jgi:hypothetical protein
MIGNDLGWLYPAGKPLEKAAGSPDAACSPNPERKHAMVIGLERPKPGWGALL